MGSFTSVLTPLVSMGKLIGSGMEAANNLQEVSAKNKALAQNAVLQKQANLLALQQKETDRLTKLRQATATQRANFGAQGIGSATGSSDAVQQGIFELSDVTRQQNADKAALDNRIIDQSLAAQQQQNLLQKQQIKQKAALSALGSLW